MSIKEDLRTIFCCAVLQVAALFGAPMRPEQIQELMHSLNMPEIARTTPEERHQGDRPPVEPGPSG